jgi:hypothetical protein
MKHVSSSNPSRKIIAAKRVRWLLALGVIAHSWAFADSPPTEASVRELLDVSNTKELVDAVRAQTTANAQATVNNMLGVQSLPAEVQASIDQMTSRLDSLLEKELGWATLEPIYVSAYSQGFTQHEIDGMIGFYRSEAGRALVEKLPAVMQSLNQTIQQRLAALSPQIQQIMMETVVSMPKKPAP